MTSSKEVIFKIGKYCANNYKSIPIVFTQGSGIFLYDEKNIPYYDFLAGYSAVNQGHCHPRIIDVLKTQSNKLTITSRACHNKPLAEFSENICNMFDYEKVLPTNTGCEAGETAIKIARAWGYMNKNIPQNNATILFAENNFWGRSISACSSSSEPSCFNNYGPYTQGFELIPYNNIKALEKKLLENKNICAFMLEPIQGEAGVIVPDDDYILNVKNICEKYNVLMIADEVQTGLGRTGDLYTCKSHGVKPDILCLGKALSGGFMPVSAVLADEHVMKYMLPGTHGSTFGGNPLGSSIASTALNIINDENLCENSRIIGRMFRDSFRGHNYSFIKNIRGVGLMNAIEFDSSETANNISNILLTNKIFTKTTHETTLRFTPPLIIKDYQMNDALEKIHKSLSIMN